MAGAGTRGSNGVSIEFSLDDHDLRQALGQLRSLSLRPPLKAAGDRLLNSAKARINAGGPAPDGTPWAPLAARTRAYKRSIGKDLGPLIMHGYLRDTLAWQLTATSVAVGSNLPYARVHQLGGDVEKAARTHTLYWRANLKTGALRQGFAKKSKSNFATDHTIKAHRVTIPARPYLGITPADATEIAASFRDHIQAALKAR